MSEFAIRRLDRADLPAIVTLANGLEWNQTSLMSHGGRYLPGERRRLYMPVTLRSASARG